MTGSETTVVWWAIQLALDIETCCSLLRGESVDERSLDPDVLERAWARRVIYMRPVAEMFEIEAAA